jgi:hypothetical protein
MDSGLKAIGMREVDHVPARDLEEFGIAHLSFQDLEEAARVVERDQRILASMKEECGSTHLSGVLGHLAARRVFRQTYHGRQCPGTLGKLTSLLLYYPRGNPVWREGLTCA